MTAPSGKFTGLGFRTAYVFELDANNLPKAASTACYEGIQFVGPKALELNQPEPRIFNHTGGDGVLDVDVLPPQEGARGTLRIGRVDMSAETYINGLKVETIGEALAMIGGANDQLGFEPQVGVFAMRQSHDENGARHWDSRVMPIATLIAQEDAWNEGGAQERAFSVTPAIVTAHLWGPAFSLATNGSTTGQFVRLMTKGRAKLVAWKADGTEDEYLFPTAKPAVSVDKIHIVTKNGVLVAPTDYTAATTGITMDAAPTADDILCCLYEY